ncbi:MAG: hypothetical protein HOQ12_16360 [Gemmatimonadaceae bacterium]|nr:hypothetical protein [Gemmatimonadaceae bacterium]NUQ94080.1 hypothetical protein [Gemmatimonadaceae bacterium]NUR21109.1 hypothetical protein [Gemmatimonadaceae bacterium]
MRARTTFCPAAAIVSLLVLAACGRAGPAPALAATSEPAPADHSGEPVARLLWLDMRNVDLHIDATHALRIRRLRGEAVPSHSDAPAVLDDESSFTVRVTSGTVALSGDALSALLNEHVFGYKGSPLRNLRVRTSGTQLVQRGIMHKGVDIPFEMTASVSLEPDGRVRLHPTKTRILGVDGEKLLHALGLHLDRLLDLSGARGASVKGDDLFLEPTKILPPPAITGRLASIRVEGDELVQEFERLPDDSVFDGYARPDSAARNYIFFRGSQLRFGKLLMTDTDLQIVDADERDPFDLYLKEYNKQLTAGTSRTLPNLGLRVLMPDYRAVATTPNVALRRD